MKTKCMKIVLLATALIASDATRAESCCSHGGKMPSADKGAPADVMISAKQIDESIASLQRMKARIPPGKDGISVRELMAMQLEDIKKSPEYAKIPAEERKRLDAAIDAARKPPAAADREGETKKQAVTAPSHETVELSGGTRAFFIPRRQLRPASMQKGRK